MVIPRPRVAVLGGDGRFQPESLPGCRVRVFPARHYAGNGPLRSLELLTAALTLAHAGKREAAPLTHHARGMVQVVRILQLQIDTYRELVAAQPADATPKKPRGRR